MTNKTNAPFKKEDSNFFRTMNIGKNFFLSQFSAAKVFVALVIVVVALLGPIIQLSSRDIATQQHNKLAIMVANPKVMAFLRDHNLISTKFDDAWIAKVIDLSKTTTLPPSLSVAALEQFKITSLSWSMLGQVFSSSILYALSLGIFSSIRDKKSVDRIRVMYINYSKNTILFFKIFMESLMFLFIVVTADTMGMILVKFVGKGSFSSAVITQLVIQLIGMFVFYFFIQVGLKLIMSKIDSKNIKGLAMGAWLLSTAFLYVVLSIVLGVKQDLAKTVADNKYVFTFIPVANIVVLPLVLYGQMDLWTIIPIIIYMIIGIGLAWKATASSSKNFSCS